MLVSRLRMVPIALGRMAFPADSVEMERLMSAHQVVESTGLHKSQRCLGLYSCSWTAHVERPGWRQLSWIRGVEEPACSRPR